MKIRHVLNGKSADRDVGSAEPGFFLSNQSGGFAHFSAKIGSKYQGMFLNVGGELLKVMEAIVPETPDSVEAVENYGAMAVFRRRALSESFFLPQLKNCMAYQLDREAVINVFLDVRRPNDFRQWGRSYTVECSKDLCVIKFTKKTDKMEDPTDGRKEFSNVVAIQHNGTGEARAEWVRRAYADDIRRNSSGERYVYKAAAITASRLTISAAATLAEALAASDGVKINIRRIGGRACGEFAIASTAAQIALRKLMTKTGMYAGLPWFFQEWSRDELVSCVALPNAEKKKIVAKYLSTILPDGRIPNILDGAYSGSPTGSADGIGWLFKRASELMDAAALTRAEIAAVAAALKKSIDGLIAHHIREGFVVNRKNETWMDTDYNDDGRIGCCIETQAMQLNMYKFMHRLGGGNAYQVLEESLKHNVRRLFWNGSILADRLNDFTTRPNFFIAAYIYPELLSPLEWEACISNALPKLWLDWGGLSTIDKNHPNFHSGYTGETNESYHRGDSWFWINNIAAIVMARINKRRFQPYIQRIAAASASDILWKGAVGCASELSSAREQRAEGCLNQAWSNATFIELARLLRP